MMLYNLANFKGFTDAIIDLSCPLTVLIGPNGSGKSNLIEGIELFSFIAQGGPLHEITDVGRGRGDGLEIRGGLQSCLRNNSSDNSFLFGFSTNFFFENKYRILVYFLAICPRDQFGISNEWLAFYNRNNRKDINNNTQIIFESLESVGKGILKVRYNNFARGGTKPTVSVESKRSLLSQYPDFAKKNQKYKVCVDLVETIRRYLRASFVFDPNPKLMRAYERIGNNILTRDGANLSSVLYALEQGGEEERQSLERLVSWIQQLPEEPYQKIGFVTTELGDVIFGLHEDENCFTDARMLSDGTLRTLALLTALETAEQGSRVIIEEFDNGLHPSRVHILTQAISDCCKRRKLNVLVTTHNPATLDALLPEQLEGVVLCVRDKKEKAAKLVRLLDLPRHDELLESGRLGDLVTRRVFEKYLSPEFEEERKQEALDWLESLS